MQVFHCGDDRGHGVHGLRQRKALLRLLLQQCFQVRSFDMLHEDVSTFVFVILEQGIDVNQCRVIKACEQLIFEEESM